MTPTTLSWSNIFGHGTLTYVIGVDPIGYLVLVYICHMMVYFPGGSTSIVMYIHDGTLLYIHMFHDYIVVFHDDISLHHYVSLMYGRMHSRNQDLGISPHDVLICITLFYNV